MYTWCSSCRRRYTRFSIWRKGVEGVAGVERRVGAGPRFLIEGLNDVVWLGDGLSQADAEGDLAVREMAEVAEVAEVAIDSADGRFVNWGCPTLAPRAAAV